MFRKVLKHDLNAILKIWSIITATVLVLSIVGGLCFRGLNAATGQQSQMAFIPLYLLGIVLSVIAVAAYGVVTVALIMIRFYKNFFTDEGYLTFTLPVKRSTLFNSKLLSAFIFNTATFLVTVIAVTVMLAIAPGGEYGGSALSVLLDSFSVPFAAIKSIMNDRLAFWICAYAVVGLAYVLVAFVHETLLLFCTVTFGSILAKKHKILTSVAVYYGIQLLFQTVWLVVEGVLSLGISAISVVPEVLVPETQVLWLVLGILLFYVCALALIASFFYKFAVSRLRGNLNLA